MTSNEKKVTNAWEALGNLQEAMLLHTSKLTVLENAIEHVADAHIGEERSIDYNFYVYLADCRKEYEKLVGQIEEVLEATCVA